MAVDSRTLPSMCEALGSISFTRHNHELLQLLMSISLHRLLLLRMCPLIYSVSTLLNLQLTLKNILVLTVFKDL